MFRQEAIEIIKQIGLPVMAKAAAGGGGNHHVRFGNRLLGLLGHLAVDAAGGVGLKAPRIDDDVLVFSLLAVPVVSVTRKSRKVGDDGVSRLGQAIEKRGLTDIRTPHEGDYWLH